jgi:hypothetical protein
MKQPTKLIVLLALFAGSIVTMNPRHKEMLDQLKSRNLNQKCDRDASYESMCLAQDANPSTYDLAEMSESESPYSNYY